ncbi:MAG: ShlB/FhaC/HecB family hemolysin secretion/activation protein, partial [Candidatus Competibacterales bacterium]
MRWHKGNTSALAGLLLSLSVAPPGHAQATTPGLVEAVCLDQVVVEGATALTPTEIQALIAPLALPTCLDFEAIAALAENFTAAYRQGGYINSGALVPDQDVTDGVLTVVVVEGRLVAVEIQGLRRLNEGVFRRRLTAQLDPPLNIDDLRLAIQRLLADPAIDRIDAELRPGTTLGEAILALQVQEAFPVTATVGADNARSPAVGGEELLFEIQWHSPLGRGDELILRYTPAEGLDQFYGEYRLPLDTRWSLYTFGEVSNSAVVEDPFEQLEVESETHTAALGFDALLYSAPGRRLTAGPRLEYRTSRTFLLGEPFAFSPATDDGRLRLALLRFDTAYSDSSVQRVMAARSTLTVGLSLFDATRRRGTADGRFVAWVGQAQWLERLAGNGQGLLRVVGPLGHGDLAGRARVAMGGMRSGGGG